MKNESKITETEIPLGQEFFRYIFTETYPSKMLTSLVGVNSFPYFLKLEIA